MRSLLTDFGVSVLGSIAAWVLTHKLEDALRFKGWRWHLLSAIVVFAAVFVGLFLLKTGNAPTSAMSKMPSTTTGTPPPTSDNNSPRFEPTPLPPQKPSSEDLFLRDYLAVGKNESPTSRWAIVLRDGDQPASAEITGAVVSVLTTKGYKVVPIFHSTIFREPGYGQLFGATSALLQRLRAVCDGIVVGEVKRTFSTDNEMQGLVTVRMNVDIRVLATKSGAVSLDLPISVRGGGFSQDTAGAQASNRTASALKQMLLSQLP